MFDVGSARILVDDVAAADRNQVRRISKCVGSTVITSRGGQLLCHDSASL